MDDFAALIRDAERDLDQVLVEELVCAPAMLPWLAAQAGIAPPTREAKVAHARRPPRADNGVDLTATFDDGRRRLVLALAVRLSGSARISQAARAEAASMVVSGRADDVRLVLIRPLAAGDWPPEADAPFDAVIPLERLVEALAARRGDARGELGQRIAHHEALIARSLQTARLHGAETHRREHASFMDGYLALLRRHAPDLPPGIGMKPGTKAPDSGMMVFAPEALPAWGFLPQTRLAHHLREGAATILLYGWGAHLSALAGVMSPALEGTSYRLAPAASRRYSARPGLLVVAATPAIDPTGPAEDQRDEIRAGLATVEGLRAWFANRKGAARYWAELVFSRDGGEGVGRVLRDVELS